MRSLWTVAVVTVVLATMATETFGQGSWRPKLKPRPKPWSWMPWSRPWPRWLPSKDERTIVGMCNANIGRCALRPQGGEGQAPRRCPGRTVPCPIFKTVSVNCSTWGVFPVKKVFGCKCCRHNLLIKGVVVDSADATIQLKDMFVSIRMPFRYRRTNDNGEFKMTVPPTTSRVVISARDRSGTYLRAIKVVEIPKGSKGPISVTIVMIKAATPIEIDASAENTLSISANPGDVAAGNATIKISAGTFRRRDGSVYSGNVKVSLNLINTADSSVEAEIPGVFLTSGSQPLMTDGIFQLTYRAADGARLRAKPMLVTVRDDMRLWSLSSATGHWEPLRDSRSNTRGRRQTPSEFLVLINDGQWVNIDKIPTAPRCYYKTRVYKESDGSEVVNSPTATFRPELLAYRVAQSQRLRLYAAPTSKPPTKCFEARCPTNAAELLVGLISLTAYEDVLVGGVNVPIVQKLRAKKLSLYTSTIQMEHQGVQYERTPSSEEIFVHFTSSATGPFFTDQATCDNSDDSQPAFHFMKPKDPSYLPYPDDVDKCTARVLFAGRGSYFENAMSNHSAPIEISAISAWNETGNNYYITYDTVMQFSNNGGDFYFACLTYRCSKANEITKVHVDIDIPMVPGNGTTVPLFRCFGEGSKTTGEIEGSFDVPVSAGSGSDYWGSSSNNCTSRERTEPFAHIFRCYATRAQSLQ